MFQAARSGGILVVTVPQHRWLWSSLDSIAKHARRYTKREMIGKMKRAGFEVLRATSFVSALTPVLFLSRLRKMDVEKACGELALPKWMDFLLERIMAVELKLIRWGVNMPVGGSLLVVGMRP